MEKGGKKDKYLKPELGGYPSTKIDAKVLEKMKCHWSIKDNAWKPPVRIGSSLTLCGNKIFMFGGFSKVALNDVMYLDNKRAKWVQIQTTKGKRPIERYGHSTVYSQGALIIFGGE
jgi:N-acetylneuraminic acid mutarotase